GMRGGGWKSSSGGVGALAGKGGATGVANGGATAGRGGATGLATGAARGGAGAAGGAAEDVAVAGIGQTAAHLGHLIFLPANSSRTFRGVLHCGQGNLMSGMTGSRGRSTLRLPHRASGRRCGGAG